MPITVAVDPARRRVTLTTCDRPTYEEACAALDQVLAHPDYRRGFDVLNDRRQAVESPHYEADSSLALADRASRLFPCRWAVVRSGSTDVTKLWMATSVSAPTGMTMAVFSTMAAALAWLEDPTPDEASSSKLARASRRFSN